MNVHGFGMLRLSLLLVLLHGCSVIDRMTGEGEAERIRGIGRSAQAVVLSSWDTGWTVNDDPIVGFELEVTDPDGERYRTKTTALISRIHVSLAMPGTVLPVKVDPQDRTKVALDVYER